MKYDGAPTDRGNPATRRLAALAGFSADDVVLLAGSTQEPEEAMMLATFRELSPRWPRLRVVLVPRHPDRFEAVAELLDSSGIPWQRRTGWKARPQAAVPRPPPPRVFLIDVIGELAPGGEPPHIAFVGGSMGSRGGQNMIEPAAYGAAVSFGPNTWNFRDIVAAMLDRNAAVVVGDAVQFTAFVQRCLEEPDYAVALGQRAQSFVQSQLGATRRTLELLLCMTKH